MSHYWQQQSGQWVRQTKAVVTPAVSKLAATGLEQVDFGQPLVEPNWHVLVVRQLGVLPLLLQQFLPKF